MSDVSRLMTSDLYLILFTTIIVGFLLIAYWNDLELEERLAGIIASLIVIPCLQVVIATHPETGEWRFCYDDQVPTYEVQVGPVVHTEFGSAAIKEERSWEVQFPFNHRLGRARTTHLILLAVGLALFKTLPRLLAPIIYHRPKRD